MFDNTIIGGICSVCGKTFKNNTKRINIAIDLRDNKKYCKSCALDGAWGIARGSKNDQRRSYTGN
ncbi:MAG TPA: hypothetical protein ENH82_11435 [bacterium]|nr:hypothetical protein [bacterium]